MYVTKPLFKKCFLLTQALAYLPLQDVVNGFVKVEEYATTNCPEYLSFLAYVEEY